MSPGLGVGDEVLTFLQPSSDFGFGVESLSFMQMSKLYHVHKQHLHVPERDIESYVLAADGLGPADTPRSGRAHV